MKKIALSAAVIISIIAASCKPEPQPEVPAPVIKAEPSEISVPAEGGEQSLVFTIENPVESNVPELQYDGDAWIHDFDLDILGFITFIVDENTLEESRSAEFEITYPGAEPVTVTVRQEGTEKEPEEPELTFEIAEVKVDEVSITTSVYPSDKEATYLTLLTSKERFDSLGDDEANFQDDMKYYEELANEQGMTLKDFLEEYILEKGDLENILVDMLEPGTEYVVYAYGLTSDAERTSSITKKYISTKAVEQTGCTFEIDPAVTGNSVSVSVTPSLNDEMYFFNMISKSMLEETYGSDILEYADSNFENELFYLQFIEGMPLDYALQQLTYKGQQKFDETLKANSDYYAFAFTVASVGKRSSEIAVCEFRTEDATMSENQLGLKVVKEGIVSVDVDITTTNSDSYGIKTFKASEVEGMDSGQLADYIMEVLNFDMGSSDARMVINGLQPETEYVIALFGFNLDSYSITTEVVTARATTKSKSDGNEISFAFDFPEIGINSFKVNLTATPEDVLYLWGITDTKTTSSQILSEIEYDCQRAIEWGDAKDKADYMRQIARSGSLEYTFTGLMEDTEYKVYAIGVSFDTGEYLGEMVMSDVVRTVKPETADMSVRLTYGKYFSGDELAEVNDDFQGAQGYLILPVKLEISGNDEAVKHYYHIHTGDVTDTEAYSDGYIKDFLNDYGKTNMGTDYAMIADNPYTLVAYGETADGKCSPVFRELVVLTADGVSPVEEYDSSLDGQSLSSAKSSSQVPFMRIMKNSDPVKYSAGTPVMKKQVTENNDTIKSVAENKASLRLKK